VEEVTLKPSLRDKNLGKEAKGLAKAPSTVAADERKANLNRSSTLGAAFATGLNRGATRKGHDRRVEAYSFTQTSLLKEPRSGVAPALHEVRNHER